MQAQSASHIRAYTAEQDTQRRSNQRNPHDWKNIHMDLPILSVNKPNKDLIVSNKILYLVNHHHEHYNQPGQCGHHRLLLPPGTDQKLV